MKRYLKTVSKKEAQKIIVENTKKIEEEELIPTYLAKDRITSRPVYAKISNPPFILSAMDGYAVASKKTEGADISNPLELKKFQEAYPVNTGDPLPEGRDAVIMVEEVEDKKDWIVIRKPANLWQNVRMIGEDTVAYEILLPTYHTITSYDIGLLIASGVTHVHVLRKPRMVIIPTGKEVIDPYIEPERVGKKGFVTDFNSYVLSSLGESIGFEVKKGKIAKNESELEEEIRKFVDYVDLIVINAGTSAGGEDFTKKVIDKIGEVIFHGVSMMPGKPFLFGKINDKPVFGIPGYPVSAVFCFIEFLTPFYESSVGKRIERESIKVRTAYKIPSRLGIEELLRVNLLKKGNDFYAVPLPRGASLISSLSMADGILSIPENLEGLDENEEALCFLIKEKSHIENRINIVGSHDICLSYLRDILKRQNSAFDLLSIHVGSLGGILAFKKGVSDLATTHILDPDEKIYNIPILKKYLPERSWRLINIAKRIIGIAVKKGNPKKIRGIEDIAKEGVKFVNRQYGSGTRILFDTLISQKGIPKEKIDGYDREESSHTRVGIMIKESIADCGLTTFSVARLFDLDFIPLAEEDFDLLVSEEFVKDAKFETIYDIITSGEFKKKLEIIGGYNLADTGKIKYVKR
ncbi:MAG: molybdopterin biosynthesis protein [Desulfobacterota bacterium]|nr:molybdopterin biosynthesis protein [Thermodesulfobacteriota bacterium]MDW8002504.1 molybdopterin biosynthesis protein [Deltaproteobacteria bacterium]